MAFLFLPAGFLVLTEAFLLDSPHVFVMFLFSGSLSLLLGAVGLIGFFAASSGGEPGASSPAESEDGEELGE
jgi:putative effector of murein hydrolase LrgA (UPF0299 family)